MRRRDFLTTSLAGAATACQTGRPRQPNVLFLFSDQQHARTVGCYGGGAPVKTPAIDRIASEGCRFDNAISINPVCSPYRGMLMSGLYPMRNGVVGNDTPLSDGLPTLGKMFRDAGYQTGYIGKWHLESHRRGFVPEARRQGFDYWAVHTCNHKHFDSPYYTDDPNRELTHQGYEPDSQTSLAIDFIRRAAASDTPFCLAISYGPPHDPYKAPEQNEARFLPAADIPLPPNRNEREIVDHLLETDRRPKSPQVRRRREARRALLEDDDRLRGKVLLGYYAACEALDTNVDRLLRTLDEAGIADDTIIVYTSDHGDLAGSHRMISKQSPLEEAIRVPFLIRYPRAISAGRATSTLLTPVDILPTLLSLSGIDHDSEQYDGVDLAGAAAADTTETRDAVLLMKMVHGGNPWIANGIRPWRGVRTLRYTYAELEGSPWLLFDNQEDPHQMENLIADPGRLSLRARLGSRLRQLLSAAGDNLTEEQIAAFRKQQISRYPG
ncbi:MAG: sulfatase [bacterium]|nr:sulfatase [bacterium]